MNGLGMVYLLVFELMVGAAWFAASHLWPKPTASQKRMLAALDRLFIAGATAIIAAVKNT